ncbi:RHS repeat domain-containing protein [Pseudomonas sp. FW306-2-11AD]|uniref:RHS repeat domain-containing protein n=1 Tax=unclassified Pseudomonas TaxID=196821 RepID=UPI000B13378D
MILQAPSAAPDRIEVRSANGSVVRMTYDPLGRRIAKTEHDSKGYPLGVKAHSTTQPSIS